jgi:GntR family transcriptional regulator, transcriptional repressor for pyruvate dehydrogenase complex
VVQFARVQHVRAYQRVVQQVEEAILGGDIHPGEHLASERDLVEQFGVSRATVREALRVLESAGLVRSRPGDPNGSEVLPLNSINLTRSLTLIARRRQLGLADLIQFRMFLEGNVCEIVASLRTEEQLAVIRAALAGMEKAMEESREVFVAADLAFHLAIAAATGNPLLQACNEAILGMVGTTVQGRLEDAPDSRAQMAESVHRHRLVLDAIERQDPLAAVHYARTHQLEYYGAYLSAADRDRLERLSRRPAG